MSGFGEVRAGLMSMLGNGQLGRIAVWTVFSVVAVVVLAAANRGGDLTIRMKVETSSSEGEVVLYFDDGSGYREEATVRAPARKGLHEYEFRLPVTRIRGFRIDPSMNDAATRIASVDALHRGSVIRQFQAVELIPVSQIDFSAMNREGRSVSFVVQRGAKDPHFVVSASSLEIPGGGKVPLRAIVFSVAVVVLSIGGLRSLPARGDVGSGVAQAGFGVVLGLVAAMAILTTTTISVSPDEESHLLAARYYYDWWLPPAVGAPASLASYSVYGFSYLTEPDVVYLIAAKLVAATSFIGLEDTIRFRLFNVLLLVACVYMATRSRVALLVALPVLCTPQAWYLFSYFNADAFALVVAILLAAAVASHLDEGTGDSHGPAPPNLKAAVTIGALLVLAILSKKTFYPIVVFVTCYALWRGGFRQARYFAPGILGLFLLAFWAYSGKPYESGRALLDSALGRNGLLAGSGALLALSAWQIARTRDLVRRLPVTLVLAIGFAVVLIVFRAAIEVYAVGWPWDKASALNALAERIAGPAFRPSTIATEAGYASAALSSKGVDLPTMLFDWRWIWQTTASLFGVYRYMDIYGPPWLYTAQFAVASLLVAAVLSRCARDRNGRGVAVLGLCCVALAIFLSIMHSWVRDFQAQGRYVLVILPIVGVMLLEATRADLVGGARSPEIRVAIGAVAVLWFVSFISFAFIGLPGIVRSS